MISLQSPFPSSGLPFATEVQDLISRKWFLRQPAMPATRALLKVRTGMTDAECLLAVEALQVSQQRLQRGFQ